MTISVSTCVKRRGAFYSAGPKKPSPVKQAAHLLPVALLVLFASANAYGATIDLGALLVDTAFDQGNQGSGCPVGWICGGAETFTTYTVTAAQYTAGLDG